MDKRLYGNNHLVSILCFLMLMSLLLLSGCSTISHRDGPPPYPVDESKIPDAVPKKEALSKYGNYKTYHVFGKSYHTMASSKNYEEQGIASWYGTKFHSVRTSSGERYNMLAMTAAHKTLPLPTYVQVTNLANGKKVVVKVNDRGPFEGNRLIDLSYVAAKKLGMIGHGTAHVDVKAIDPAEYNNQILTNDINLFAHNKHSAHPYAHHTTHVAMSSAYFLQVGAFKSRVYAERLKNRLSRVVASPVHITQRAQRGKLYHVQIGPIRDVATMGKISKHLKAIGLSSHKVNSSITEV